MCSLERNWSKSVEILQKPIVKCRERIILKWKIRFNLGVRAKMTLAMHALIRLAHGFPPGKTIDPDVVGEE